MRGTDLSVIERPCDGHGKCLLGVRRLSRVKLATSSPERQRENVLTAAASVGAHIIGWADAWEVSGATDPMTRPSLGRGCVTSGARTTAWWPPRSIGWAATSSTA